MFTRTSRSPNGVDGRVDQPLGPLPVGDVVAVDDRLAAQRHDLGDDFAGRAVVRAGTVVGAAEVVDDDLGALGGEQQRVLATDAAPGSGDDRDASLECSHEPGTVVAMRGPPASRSPTSEDHEVDGRAATEPIARRDGLTVHVGVDDDAPGRAEQLAHPQPGVAEPLPGAGTG